MNWIFAGALAGMLSGITNFLFKMISNASPSVFGVAAFFGISSLIMTGYGLATRAQDLPAAAWSWASAAAVVFVASNVMLYKSLLSGGNATITYGLYGSLSLLVLTMIAMVFLGEKLNWMGWLGVWCAVAAVVLLANGKA